MNDDREILVAQTSPMWLPMGATRDIDLLFRELRAAQAVRRGSAGVRAAKRAAKARARKKAAKKFKQHICSSTGYSLAGGESAGDESGPVFVRAFA